MSSGKGSNFEREVAKELSLWWTNGKRDDVFWRTSGSGARATTRTKNRRRTSGQYGDICATDPIGEPLVDLLTIELKRGFNACSLMDLVDRAPSTKQKQFEKWIYKTVDTCMAAGSFSWMLIARRDRRVAMAYMPLRHAQELFEEWFSSTPSVIIEIPGVAIFGGAFDSFLKTTCRKDVERLSRGM